MADRNLAYTITSTDPDSYNVIRTNLQVPFGDLCKLSVSNLTTKASFILLTPEDYIIINDVKYNFKSIYGELSTEAFTTILDDLLIDLGITSTVDNVGRLIISSNTVFTINDMSYNAKMISGFYNDTFPITSEGSIQASSVGFPLSTPILYLVSNLGAKCYENKDEIYRDRKVLMRVSNSFTFGYPIINSNAEFASITPVNSLSNIEFRLVDANMHDIKLLAPMYICVNVDALDQEQT